MNKIAELEALPNQADLNVSDRSGPDIERLGNDLWIINGPKERYLGLDLPTRMTIVRIKRQLWIHSPIPLTDKIIRFMNSIGDPAFIIAPNKLHHLSLLKWRYQFPSASFFAPPGLKRKRRDINFEFEMLPDLRYTWSTDILHLHFTGNLFIKEVVFFHRASRTLILSDLLFNVRDQDFSGPQKLFAKFDQILYPNGGSPRLFRWTMGTKKAARKSYQKFLEWDPENVVISHGEYFRGNGRKEIEARLGWLKP